MNKILHALKRQFGSKKVLVVGLGLQGGGVGIAKFFAELGVQVTVTDKKTKQQLVQSINRLDKYAIDYTLGEHKLNDFLSADIIFKAPKMRWDDTLLLAAQKKGVQIEMESAFFTKYCPSPIIGITGTRGKSTTTMMIYELLKKLSSKKVHLAGNIPQTSTVQHLKSIAQNDLVVMELSSWQLSGFHRKKLSPHLSVFTNFYPDHLDYYKSLAEYLYDKKAIFLYQKAEDYLIINNKLKNVLSDSPVPCQIKYFSTLDFPDDLKWLKGKHNQENAAAALQVAKILRLDLKKSIAALKNFRGLPYRQEIIAEKDGIIFVNDTTSTTPTATIKALEAFSKNKIILILGGNSKNLPTNVLINRLALSAVEGLIKIVLLKGTFTAEILPILKQKFSEKILGPYDNLDQAVKISYKMAKLLTTDNRQLKTIILFSPSATSFAMFNNEFERGEEFNKIANKILKSNVKAQMSNQIQSSND